MDRAAREGAATARAGRARLGAGGVAALGLAWLVLGLAGCATPAGAGGRPPWVDGLFEAGAEELELLGAGSAIGRGPDAAELARQRALAAIVQQLSAQVTSESTSRDRESAEQSRGAGATGESSSAHTDRERTITVSGAAELRGAQFELAEGRENGVDVTWALAQVNRAELLADLAGEVRAGLDAARDQLDAASAAFAGPAATGPIARGAVAALAGDEALEVPRARLPLLAAAAGHRTPIQDELTAELSLLSDQSRALGAELSRRLDLGLDGAPPRLRLSGQLDTLVLRARWDGAPLAGLPVAARLGDGAPAHAFTDERGLASLRLPQASGAAGPLRAGIALDGRPGPDVVTLPIAVPAAASARVTVITRLQRDAAPGAPATATTSPSPLQAPLEQALGALHFLVVAPGEAQRAPADYTLDVTTHAAFRSREGRQQQGVVWYGTSLEARFIETASGDAFSIAIPEAESRDAGVTADQAAQRSLARALARLLDDQRPGSLPALLRARFR